MEAVLSALADSGADVERDVELAARTTLRVGGRARAVVTVTDERMLTAVLDVLSAADWPWFVLGRGSNLIVPDRGWPGAALRLAGAFSELTSTGDRVSAGAAVPLPTVAVHAAEVGLGGFAWGVAVPGTVGGAVRMNAGAHGADMSDALVSARVVTPSGARDVPVAELGLGYRTSALTASEIVTSATLRLEPADRDEVRAEMDAIRAWRRTHQPLHAPTCGSVFTNPDGASAGGLIEAAGMKGHRVGGALISPTHANFIETREGARAADVLRLIAEVQEQVLRTSGVHLAREVVVLDPELDPPEG